MKKQNRQSNGSERPDSYLSQLQQALSSEQLTTIDFDRLRQWLDEKATILREHHRTQEELAVLRDDYLQRIAGMAKAIAAVDRRGRGLRETAAYLEHLPTLSAADLVRQYRAMSARFRAAFPTSFGALLPAAGKSGPAGGR